MKKIIAVAAILAALAAATRFGYDAGKTAGINHAIEDSEIFTVECYDPYDPYRNTRPDGLDQTIYIVLDGEYYEHGMWQG